MNKVGFTTRFCNGNCPATRKKKSSKIDEKKREIPFVMISSDNAGERLDWWSGETFVEELDVSGANVERLKTFFKNHSIYVDDAIGRVEKIEVKDDELHCVVVFGNDEDSDKIFRKYIDGTLNDVSIGYNIRDIVVTEKKGEPTHILATDYDIIELSSVGVGFDAGAGRSNKGDKNKKDKKRVKKNKKNETKKGASVEMLAKKLKLKGR